MPRKRPDPPPDDDRPWTEEQWEQLFRESDVRSAKFGEIFETVMDDPDRDEIIDREMGWDRDEPSPEAAEEIAAMNEALNDAEALAEAEQEIRRRDEELERLPAYSKAYDFGLRVHDAIKSYLDADTDEEDDDLTAAMSNCFIIAVKLAGAHGMGYEDEALCGNIVRCKRSLEAADACLAALKALRTRKVMPTEVVDPLIRDNEEVLQLVKDHIAELRSRVWWS